MRENEDDLQSKGEKESKEGPNGFELLVIVLEVQAFLGLIFLSLNFLAMLLIL